VLFTHDSGSINLAGHGRKNKIEMSLELLGWLTISNKMRRLNDLLL